MLINTPMESKIIAKFRKDWFCLKVSTFLFTLFVYTNMAWSTPGLFVSENCHLRQQAYRDRTVYTKDTSIVVGVPKEIKSGEKRVGITPKEVRELVARGVVVVIEKGAGLKSGITDKQLRDAGATIVDTREEVWARADIIKKVKEPLPEEYRYFRRGQILYTYFHLANPENKELTEKLTQAGVTAIAYESVKVGDITPLLRPMSHIAGWIAPIWGALLRRTNGDYTGDVNPRTHIIKGERTRHVKRGMAPLYAEMREDLEAVKAHTFTFSGEDVLREAGIPEDGAGNVVILGGGDSGREAAYMALLIGSKKITISEPDAKKRKVLRREFRRVEKMLGLTENRVVVINPDTNQKALDKAMREMDLLVPCVYKRTKEGSATAPILIDEAYLEELSREHGFIIVSIAIDQGGNVVPAFSDKYAAATSVDGEPDLFTYHDRLGRLDTYELLRVDVPNMPAAFGHIASPYLNEATQPILLALTSGKDVHQILAERPEIMTGISIINGRLIDGEVARQHEIGPEKPAAITNEELEIAFGSLIKSSSPLEAPVPDRVSPNPQSNLSLAAI